jgi:hypothetical protein
MAVSKEAIDKRRLVNNMGKQLSVNGAIAFSWFFCFEGYLLFRARFLKKFYYFLVTVL